MNFHRIPTFYKTRRGRLAFSKQSTMIYMSLKKLIALLLEKENLQCKGEAVKEMTIFNANNY